MKALFRDVNADPMSNMSVVMISNRESGILKSREKGNDFIGILCAYRLLDVIVELGTHWQKKESKLPPIHLQMEISSFKNEVCFHFVFARLFSHYLERFATSPKLDSYLNKISAQFHEFEI